MLLNKEKNMLIIMYQPFTINSQIIMIHNRQKTKYSCKTTELTKFVLELLSEHSIEVIRFISFNGLAFIEQLRIAIKEKYPDIIFED